MNVSVEAVEEFKRIYKQEYGINLDDKTARQKAIKVLKVIRIVYSPLKRPDKKINGVICLKN